MILPSATKSERAEFRLVHFRSWSWALLVTKCEHPPMKIEPRILASTSACHLSECRLWGSKRAATGVPSSVQHDALPDKQDISEATNDDQRGSVIYKGTANGSLLHSKAYLLRYAFSGFHLLHYISRALFSSPARVFMNVFSFVSPF